MTGVRRMLGSPSVRPYVVLIILLSVLLLAGQGNSGRIFSSSTVYSTFQQFATLGPVALGIGLSMMIGEFDLSIAGIFGLTSCMAVLISGASPLLGLGLALSAGAAGGALQGGLMVGLGLSSVAVTLGGLLTFGGLAYVLTGNQTIGFQHADWTAVINMRLGGMFSPRSIVSIVLFGAAALFVSWTRTGRDMIAVGSDRRAARIAGVQVDKIVVGVFATSGLLAALSGSLLSYGLAAASPVALADILVPAVAAAIMGGVSLSGGTGRPLGIAGGVLIICVLRSGLTAIDVPPYVHNVVTACVLLAVAVLDGRDLPRRLHSMKGLFTRPGYSLDTRET